MEPSKQSEVFDKHAKFYRDRRKKRTIDTKYRERLLELAHGDILELSVGTGTNFPIYKNATSITAVDFSREMVHYAREAADEVEIDCKVIHEDVEKAAFDRQFDTVVSTLSLCSYPQPEYVLEQMSKWCKPGGQVLLLEHGISSNRMTAKVQTIVDPHIEPFLACHIDRDILDLVQNSSLEIKKVESHLMGVFHLIWATPEKRLP